MAAAAPAAAATGERPNLDFALGDFIVGTELGAAGDKAGYAAQAKVLQQGCNSCHKLYRAEERHH